MGEVIIVCVIISGVLILAGRSLYRTFTGKNQGCGCGSGSGCTPFDTCQESEDDAKQKSRNTQ